MLLRLIYGRFVIVIIGLMGVRPTGVQPSYCILVLFEKCVYGENTTFVMEIAMRSTKVKDRVKLHVMPNVMCVGYALMHMQESDRHVVLFNSLLIPKACAILSDASGMHTQNTNL